MPRSICDTFLEEVNKVGEDAVLPVLVIQKNYLINIHREKLWFLSVVANDVPPLLVLEFLHRVCDIFIQYFGALNETSIRDNFATVYQVCFEMKISIDFFFILWEFI
jgi:AP-3 complex subunit mu